MNDKVQNLKYSRKLARIQLEWKKHSCCFNKILIFAILIKGMLNCRDSERQRCNLSLLMKLSEKKDKHFLIGCYYSKKDECEVTLLLLSSFAEIENY